MIKEQKEKKAVAKKCDNTEKATDSVLENMQKLEIEEVIIPHSEHKLEGRYYKNEDKNSPTALLLSPHPMQNGTMNTKVIYRTFHALINCGFSVLRFNYRGVGKSGGEYDGGPGELTDAAVALNWLQDKHPKEHWVVGFSWGAWIGLQLTMRRPEIDGYVLISPPVQHYAFDFISPCPIPGLIVQGSNDEISKESHSYELYTKLSKQKNAQVKYHVVEDADHLYTKHKAELISEISDFIKDTRSVDREPRYKKAKRVRNRNIT